MLIINRNLVAKIGNTIVKYIYKTHYNADRFVIHFVNKAYLLIYKTVLSVSLLVYDHLDSGNGVLLHDVTWRQRIWAYSHLAYRKS